MKLRSALFAAAAMFASCGNEAVTTDSDSSLQDSKEIVGGFDAKAKALDAVGTIGVMDGDTYAFTCSATLITPDTVLTAKHCAMVTDSQSPLFGMKLVNLEQVFFAIGSDASRPAKIVEVIAADLSPVEQGGANGIGSDMALLHLIEPITDVAPIKIADAQFVASDVNKGFAMVGFGTKNNYDYFTGQGSPTRATGKATLRALQGKDYQLMFGTWEAFFRAMASYYGLDIATQYEAVIRGWYDNTVLLKDYEAYTGHVTGDAQLCHGDTGGPLIGREAGEKKIFGVASAMFFSSQLVCDYGAFYATFGPETRGFIEKGVRYSDPCAGGITVAGRCDRDVAIRCSDKWEGDRSRSELDCSLLDQECVIGANGRAGCGDVDETPVHPAAPTAAEIRASIANAAHKMVELKK